MHEWGVFIGIVIALVCYAILLGRITKARNDILILRAEIDHEIGTLNNKVMDLEDKQSE
jgi:hypothetical protein